MVDWSEDSIVRIFRDEPRGRVKGAMFGTRPRRFHVEPSLRAARLVSGLYRAGQCLFPRERTDGLARIKPDRGGQIEELQYVQSPIAPSYLAT